MAVPFNSSWGTCFYCKRGLLANCENTHPNSDLAAGVYGYSHATGGWKNADAADLHPARRSLVDRRALGAVRLAARG